MVDNGLDISEEQFKKMKSLERDVIIFRNTVHNRRSFKDYKFHKKIQYVWLVILTLAVGLKKYIVP